MNKRIGWTLAAVALMALGLFFLWPDGRAEEKAVAGAETAGGTTSALRASGGAGAKPVHPVKVSGLVSGWVVDPEGKGIARAQVCAVSFGRDITGEEQHAPNCILADETGEFRFPALWAGPHSIEATAWGYLPSNELNEKNLSGRETRELEIEAGEERSHLVIVLEPGGQELVGEVTDVGGGPIAGAWVELHPLSASGENLPTASARAMSDDEGKVRLWLGKGGYSVEASAEGYVTEHDEIFVPGMALTVSLVPGSTLRGSVVYDGDKGSAPYAFVTANMERGRWFSARADEKGEFLFTRLPAGRYEVSASTDDGRGGAERSVVVALGQDLDQVLVTLESGATVQGRVVKGEDERPCDKASGRLIDSNYNSIGSRPGEAEGEILFTAVAPGRYSLMVSCDEHRREKMDALEIEEEDLLDQTWRLKDDGFTVAVKVVGDSGEPVAGAQVFASETEKNSFFERGASGKSDEEGVATLHGVPDARVSIEARAEGLVMKGKPVELEGAGDGSTVELQMTGGGVIEGVVRTKSGSLPTGLRVTARAEQSDDDVGFMMRAKAMVMDDGSFRIEGLSKGSYKLMVLPSNWAFNVIETEEDESYLVSLGGAATQARLTIGGQTGSLRGRVVNSRGEPLVDAFVRVIRDEGEKGGRAKDWELRSSWLSKDLSLTDLDGRFVVDGLPEGPYVVRAYRRGGGEAIEKGIAEGSDVTLTIVDTGRIGGVVLSADGTPEKNYEVQCLDPTSRFEREERVSSEEGRFLIEGLPPGSYRLSVKSSKGTAESELIELAASAEVDGVRLKLRASGRVTGRVVSLESGEPVPKLWMSARSVSGQLDAGSFMEENLTDEEGRFELDEVPAGSIRVSGFSPGITGARDEWGPVGAMVEVPPGETVDLGDLLIARVRASSAEVGDLGFDIEVPDDRNLPLELVVGEVRVHGPAERAGLEIGDRIVTIDGHDVSGDKSYLYYSLATVAVGTTVAFGLESGKEIEITAGAYSKKE